MKKFTKSALIVVLITGIVGGCLAGVGLVFGGSVRSITGNLQIAVCIMFLGEHVGITKDRGGIWTMILTIIVIALEI